MWAKDYHPFNQQLESEIDHCQVRSLFVAGHGFVTIVCEFLMIQNSSFKHWDVGRIDSNFCHLWVYLRALQRTQFKASKNFQSDHTGNGTRCHRNAKIVSWTRHASAWNASLRRPDLILRASSETCRFVDTPRTDLMMMMMMMILYSHLGYN